jgi:GAF domain-containing protein
MNRSPTTKPPPSSLVIAAQLTNLMTDVQRLCTQLEHREIKREAFLDKVTRLVTTAIDCSRTSLWSFVDTAQGRVLHCLVMYDGVRDRMVEAPDEISDVEAYFHALEHAGHVLAVDVHNHPAISGAFAGRLESRGVRSLLAVSFSVNGELYGAFTCTSFPQCNEWTAAQLFALRRIASRASLALFNSSRTTGTTDVMPLA